jgi:hypothetical protein
VYKADDDEYPIYVNSRHKTVATWSDFDEENSLRIENALKLAVGRLYVERTIESTEAGNHWEEAEILRLVLVPPAEPSPEPASLYSDAGELGLNIECLYLAELGQTKIDKAALETVKRGRRVAVWHDDHNISGCFRNELFKVRRGRRVSENELLLTRTWESWWPYCGSGKQIYLIGISETPQL